MRLLKYDTTILVAIATASGVSQKWIVLVYLLTALDLHCNYLARHFLFTAQAGHVDTVLCSLAFH